MSTYFAFLTPSVAGSAVIFSLGIVMHPAVLAWTASAGRAERPTHRCARSDAQHLEPTQGDVCRRFRRDGEGWS